jgi:hypothetical protein
MTDKESTDEKPEWTATGGTASERNVSDTGDTSTLHSEDDFE